MLVDFRLDFFRHHGFVISKLIWSKFEINVKDVPFHNTQLYFSLETTVAPLPVAYWTEVTDISDNDETFAWLQDLQLEDFKVLLYSYGTYAFPLQFDVPSFESRYRILPFLTRAGNLKAYDLFTTSLPESVQFDLLEIVKTRRTVIQCLGLIELVKFASVKNGLYIFNAHSIAYFMKHKLGKSVNDMSNVLDFVKQLKNESSANVLNEFGKFCN